MARSILVTGGAGFIGSNFVLRTAAASGVHVVNLDKVTYAGNVHNLAALRGSSQHTFVQGDIQDRELVRPGLPAKFSGENSDLALELIPALDTQRPRMSIEDWRYLRVSKAWQLRQQQRRRLR